MEAFLIRYIFLELFIELNDVAVSDDTVLTIEDKPRLNRNGSGDINNLLITS